MPTDKDFKRLVRGRMRKTGEAYTTARAHLLAQRPRARVTAKTSPPAPSQYAALAGRSDAAVKESTGCTWERWVKALDRAEAYTWSHPEIAKHVREKYRVPGWWAQTVTVGYERIKGLRAVGQRRDGLFDASKSRTFAVPLNRLYRAFEDPKLRARWLPGIDLTVRTATRDKSMRITWPDGTSVEIGFVAKGADKSQVALQHSKLSDRAAVTRIKQFWTVRLTDLAEALSSE
jgi:hypothetical protein